MAKPDITLEPSKGVVSEMAAQIYSAYIIRGDVQEGEEDQYMERSIREAVRIAKTVERSVETEDAPAAGEDARSPSGDAPPPRASETSKSKPTSTPSRAGARPESDLDAVIEEALSGEDTPTVRRKDQ
jgi:hypothetical protein